MKTIYNTEIIEKSARTSEFAYSTQDFEQIQKNRMLGRLYDQVSQYYRDLINNKKASLGFGYFEDENGVEMAHAGIFDNQTGEQIL